LIACFQKQMEMQKDSAFSAWLFLVKPLPRSIRNEVKDIPVPATRKDLSSKLIDDSHIARVTSIHYF
jgi:hypothetical protein